MIGTTKSSHRTIEKRDDAGRAETGGFARAKRQRLLVVAVVSAVGVVALAAFLIVTTHERGRPVPRGVAMRVTRAEGWQGEPAISPDGERVAYVSNESGNPDIYVTDILGGRALRLTDDAAPDYAPAWLPDGTALVFVSERTGTRSVWKIEQSGGGATMLVEDAVYPAVSPDGRRMAFSRPSESIWLRIWVASLDDSSDARPLTTGEHGLWDHVFAAWSPDGTTLSYAAHRNIWSAPVDGGAPRQLTGDGIADGQPAWSSDGRYVYFESWREGSLGLWRVPSSGGAVERMTQSTGIESDPSVSVDGARLAYSVGDPGSGGVIADLATGHQTAFGKMRVILQASIAPDCDRMVFVSQRWDKRGELAEQVLVDGVPSGSPRRLTDQEGTASHPVYSPDGKWIAYYLILDGELDIWIVPSEGGRPVRFTDHPEHDVHPAWSPDGSELVFASRREGPYGVWVAPVDDGKPAGEARRLTDGSAVAFAPVWSPDGTEIAFVGASEGGLDVWLLPADGSEPATRLTDGVDATRIRWEGTGERILMAATCGANRRSLWTVSLETGAVAPFETEILFGSAMYPGLFDLSRDGRLLVFARESLEGDVWISDGRPGLF